MIDVDNIVAEKIRKLLKDVSDPEIPVLSVIDLGIIRDIVLHDDDSVNVILTPTYSGCPAMDVIKMNIKIHLHAHGYKNIKVIETLSPPWTTDWMTGEGKMKLKEYGIAPPNPRQQACDDKLFAQNESVQCPHCDSYHSHRVSEFGSTACKALYVCDDCKEPFDHFKCH